MYASVRVTLLGQNSIVREGLRRILSDSSFDVRQSVADQSRLSDTGCDDDLLILIDGNCDPEGVEVIRTLHRQFPAVKLVVLSDGFDFDTIAMAFRAGVCGYIVKEISCEPLVASLRLVALGEKVVPSRLIDSLALLAEGGSRDSGKVLLENAQLSARENESLACLVTGCSNKVISRRLAISEATVKVHVKAILRKLRVKNRTQAAIQGINGGLEMHSREPVLAMSLVASRQTAA